MTTTKIAALGTLTAAVLAGGGLLAQSTSTRPVAADAPEAAPAVNPAHFNHPQQNRYFPLEVGTVFRYRGVDEGERLRELVTVTAHKKTIEGVRTTVVRDVVRSTDGTLVERTHDWYAADDDGNVWYFGEATATYDEEGDVESREGSWQAGVDGAVAGIIMPADPRPTDAYRQELYRGQAEDQAWIVQRHFSVEVPYGRVRDVVRSFEWSRLEPRVMSTKLYGPGLGIIRERDISGGNESFELVSVEHP